LQVHFGRLHLLEHSGFEGIRLGNSQVPFHFYDFLMNRAKVIEFGLIFQNLASTSKTNMN
jgi:hypothetical protein